MTEGREIRRDGRCGRAAAGLLAGIIAVAAAACGSGQAPATAAAPPPTPVETVTLGNSPVERTSEFVGTVKSRRSTTIQPQVDGIIRRIAVESGARVRPGQVLLEIDAERQQASVAALQSQRAARVADFGLAKQQAERARTLLEAGAGSQQEFDQAAAGLAASDAQVKAIDEQIKQQQVELGYYRVTSPTAGVVGDIPVRVGDRVTSAMMLTTVDQNAGLEIYVSIPVAQATGLKVGLPLRLLDEQNKVIGTYKVGFISPSVDDTTQTVLVKADVEAGGFRTDQFVRVQVLWSTLPGLTVPVVAVNRVNGEYFAFVAEDDGKGATVAHQRGVLLGPVVGNDYVLESGLKAGDRLIVSGIQKIADGAPVRATERAAGKS
ncbi:MAG: efflux RND transporter periplasmic adaptor subunit [Vicinamibacteraceae bacterium]